MAGDERGHGRMRGALPSVGAGEPRGRYAGERRSWQGPSADAAAPARPRPAASVLLLRAGAADPVEVFMVRRSATSRFAADVFVFPGGTYRPEDNDPRVLARVDGLTPESAHARLSARGGTPPETAALSVGLHVAALRELFEEAGVLLANAGHGDPLGPIDPAMEGRLGEARAGLQSGQLRLADLLEREGLRLAADRLSYFSHWITPPSSPRRFDTRFFVAAMPTGQTAVHCAVETTAGEWVAPAVALGRCARGDLKLVYVTIEHLRRLAPLPSLDAALELARRKPVHTVCPSPDGSGGWRTGLEGDAW